MAKELTRLDYVTINKEPGDINYFINYALYRDIPGVSVGLFTHLEDSKPYRQRFETVAKLVDYHTGISAHTWGLLNNLGVNGCRVIHPGTDLQKPIVFGVCGKVHASGRKGEHLVKTMVDYGFTVVAWGKGWPCQIMSDRLEDRQEFYEFIDYLVITATNESGPVPVAEAIGMGVPVIAPDVGWCWDFPVIRYEKGNWKSLNRVLLQLTNPPSWASWIAEHAAHRLTQAQTYRSRQLAP
jgi:hypothetical protein